MIYAIKKYISIFLSKLRWMGFLHPFWFVLGPRDWKLDGADFEAVSDVLLPGDIVISRVDGFISTWLLPGWWNHAGVCIPRDFYDTAEHYWTDTGIKVVHATAKGVHEDYLYDFMRADHIIVLRPYTDTLASRAAMVASGYSKAAVEYDFDFDFTDPGKFSCTELAAACYPGILKTRKGLFGRKILVADDIVKLAYDPKPKLHKILEIRK